MAKRRKKGVASPTPRSRRAATRSPPRDGNAVAKPKGELGKARQQLKEAIEQQKATAEVLQVIASSPGKLEPVFRTMLENATRICDAKFGILWLREGDGFRSVMLHNVPAAYAEQRQ